MKRSAITGLLLLTGLILPACEREDQQSKTDGKVTGGEVARKTKEAANAAGQYVAEKKDEYVARMQNELQSLDARIDQLKAQASKTGEKVSANVQQKIDELEAKSRELGRKLDRIKESSASAWEQMKSGFDEAMGDLRSSYDRAANQFKSVTGQEEEVPAGTAP